MEVMSEPIFKNPLENVVAYSAAETAIYLGSPSLALLPDDGIVASHDFFGPNSPKDSFGRENTTRIYHSDDGGKTWIQVADVKNAFWSSFFTRHDALYLLGCSARFGDIVIRRSDDSGRTWTDPLDEYSGLLFRGGQGYNPPNYHCAPVPVLDYYGRLWRAFEDNVTASWPDGFHALVISADADTNLLKASSWRMTNRLAYNPNTDLPDFDHEKAGWLEGNVVPAPNGMVWNILRVNSVPVANKAAITKVSRDGKNLSFNPATGFIDFPGGMSKFTIRYDHESRQYWTLTNKVFNQRNPWQRNVLVLASSEDLVHWKHRCILLHVHEDENLVGGQCKIGFQYADWLFDGDDLIFLTRTAYNGAHNFHDANYITFYRLTYFRERFSSQKIKDSDRPERLKGTSLNRFRTSTCKIGMKVAKHGN